MDVTQLVLARGRGIGQQVVTGPGRRCRRRQDFASIVSGEVVVLPRPDSELVSHIERVAGIVAESGNLSAHLVQMAIEFGVPFLLAMEPCATFVDGELLLLDPGTGRLHRLPAELGPAP